MFNKTIVDLGYMPYEKTVIEERAPTDDSVKLLNEMEDKALTNLICKERLDCNGLKLEMSVFALPEVLFDYQVVVRYNINGKDHRFDGRIGKKDLNPRELIQQFSHHLSVNMLVDEMEKTFSELRTWQYS